MELYLFYLVIENMIDPSRNQGGSVREIETERGGRGVHLFDLITKEINK